MQTPAPTRAGWIWPLALFGVALALRLAHLLSSLDSPFFSILYIDPLMYDEWARRIAAGQLLSERPFFLDPLYPYFLGSIYAVFGHRLGAVVALQSLIGATVAPLVFLSARRWFDLPTARIAGTIAAIYIPSVYFCGLIMKPGLAMALVTLALWLISEALITERGEYWLLAGLVFGLACLTRGNLLLVMPVVVVWLLLRGDEQEPSRSPLAGLREHATRRSRQLAAGLVAAGVAAVLVLPALHNYVVGGELILTTANAGANFYIGNNESNHTGEYQQLPFIRANPKYEQLDFSAEALRRSGREMTDREVSSFWFAESLRWIREEPGAWVRLLARKVHSFWGAFEIPDSLDYYLSREFSPVLRLPIPGFGLLSPLALLGMGLVWRRRGWPRLLIWIVLAYAATIVFFFVFSRFRMVVAPALFVFAAHALVGFWRRGRALVADRSAWRPAVALVAAFVALFAFVNLPVRARPESIGYRVADFVGLPVKPETSSLGRYNLGVAYAREAKESPDEAQLLALAEAELRHALELAIDLDHATIHVELAKVLSRQERKHEAVEVLLDGLPFEPRNYLILYRIGRLHLRAAELAPAAAAFEQALSIEPRHVASAVYLGEALLGLGRAEDAARVFRHALAWSPNDRKAAAGLATAEERIAGR